MDAAGLAREKHVSLTTFNRGGTPAATPVWVAGADQSGKITSFTVALSVGSPGYVDSQ